jgi:hypothetical protein
MTQKAKAVMSKIKNKTTALAKLPEEIIKKNIDTPSNILHYRTGIGDIDLAISHAEKMVPMVKSTRAYQAGARMLKPSKDYVVRAEHWADTKTGLKQINRAKYLVAGAAGIAGPPGTTEAIAAGASLHNMAGYALHNTGIVPKATKILKQLPARALNLGLRALHSNVYNNLLRM